LPLAADFLGSARDAEIDLTLDDVYRADEVFCTRTMGELAAVMGPNLQLYMPKLSPDDDINSIRTEINL